MDPATIFQIVGTVVSLGDVVIKCIARLSTLKAQFHDAPIIVTSMIGQLHMVKIAQDQLSTLTSAASTNDPRYHQLATHIGNALDSFSPILLALGQQLDRYEGIGADRMATRTRLGFLNGEREMTNLSILLDRQVNALNLLLQAIQCTTWTQQSEVIAREESQSILRLAQDCSSSLLGLGDVASFISENTAAISAQFEFDDVLRSTLLYQTAERSHLRQAIRARRTKNIERTSTDNFSLRSATSGFRHAFQFMKLFRPIEESGVREVEQETKPELFGDHGGRRDNNHPQENPVNGSKKSTKTLFNRNDSSPGNWRKAFQQRVRSGSNIKPRQHSHKGDPPPEGSKVLLLGIPESGKTTLLNALHLFVGNERTEKYRELVWNNAMDAISILMEEMEDSRQQGQYYPSVPTLYYWGSLPMHSETARQYASEIKELSQTGEFQSVLDSRSARKFHDNSEYFIRNFDRLAEQAINQSGPTQGDVLRTRVTTLGIHQTALIYKDTKYLLHDLGGERTERRKWIRVFEHTATVVFLVDTTGYGRALYEDESVDRMEEQFCLWKSIVNNSSFIYYTSFLVVFTKMDLLEGHLKREDVRNFLIKKGVPVTTEHYLESLETKFTGFIDWPVFRKARIRFVRANLVDAETRSAAVDVMEALESFDESWESEFASRTATVKQSGLGDFVTVNEENGELLPNNALVSEDIIGSPAESSNSDGGRLLDNGSDIFAVDDTLGPPEPHTIERELQLWLGAQPTTVR